MTGLALVRNVLENDMGYEASKIEPILAMLKDKYGMGWPCFLLKSDSAWHEWVTPRVRQRILGHVNGKCYSYVISTLNSFTRTICTATSIQFRYHSKCPSAFGVFIECINCETARLPRLVT